MIEARKVDEMSVLERACFELATEAISERLRIYVSGEEHECVVCGETITGGLRFHVRGGFICEKCIGKEIEKLVELLYHQLWDRVRGL